MLTDSVRPHCFHILLKMRIWLNINRKFFQLDHEEHKLYFNEIMMISALY